MLPPRRGGHAMARGAAALPLSEQPGAGRHAPSASPHGARTACRRAKRGQQGREPVLAKKVGGFASPGLSSRGAKKGHPPANRPSTNQGPCSSACFLGLQAPREGGKRGGASVGEARAAAGGRQHSGKCQLASQRILLRTNKPPGTHHLRNLTSGSSLVRHCCTISPVTCKHRCRGHTRGTVVCGHTLRTLYRTLRNSWHVNPGTDFTPDAQLHSPLSHHEGADGAPPAAQDRVQDCGEQWAGKQAQVCGAKGERVAARHSTEAHV